MAQAPRDGNFVPVALGMSSSDSSTTLPFTVDSLTSRLLIDITATTSVVGTLPSAPADRDQNFVAVGMGVSADDGVTPIPLLMDSRNGLIYCDVITV